ncbi:MAG: ABC transporter permease, partial [Verrucomicrobia bacterium]|nr:ABC transporter permease [Verrucomicrobiota bacterium]
MNCLATIIQSLRDAVSPVRPGYDPFGLVPRLREGNAPRPHATRHLPFVLPKANEDAVITHLLRTVGRRSLAVVAGLGDFAEFVVRAFTAVGHARQLRKGVARAIHQQGVRCLLVITVVSLFSGLVLGLQGYYVLARFGSAGLLGTFVS